MQSSFVPIMNNSKPLDLAKCGFKKYQLSLKKNQ